MIVHEKKRVLLLGGTGAMGTYLVPELHAAGYKTYVTSRSERRSNEREIIYLKGNAKDNAFLDEILKLDFDAIIDFMTYSTIEFEERYHTLLENTEHYLFLSSYRVYADNNVNPISENSPRLLDCVNDKEYLNTDEYALAKARQENLLFNSGYSNWTVLRPAITYSQERFQLGTMEAQEFLYRTFKGKPIIFPKQMLNKKATMSWAGDVAKMICRMVLNEDAKCEAFTVSTAENHTWSEIIDYYKEIVGTDVKLVDLSVYTDIIGRPYQIKYDRMFNRVIDNTKALTIADLTQEQMMPLKDGLKIELSRFARNPNFRSYSKKRENAIDKITYSGNKKYVVKLKLIAKKISKKRRQKALVKSVFKVLRKKFATMRKLHREGSLFAFVANTVLKFPVIRPASKKYYLRKYSRYDGVIVTLTGTYNYGSVAQRWALQTLLNSCGYKFKLFDMPFMSKKGTNVGNRKAIEKFIKKYLDSELFIEERAKYYSKYIVGSDQVWRDFHKNWKKFSVFFLSFLGQKKTKRIGYAISFGHDTFTGPYLIESKRERISEYVKKFDSISVRENSGVELVNQLGKEAVHVLDPTLLLTQNDYSQLIDNSKYSKTDTPRLFYYILDESDTKSRIIGSVEKELKLVSGGITPNDGKPLAPMEIWFKGFRDSEFVLTDSFHGMVFSIINQKPFLVFANENRGLARMSELLEYVGLESRLIIDGSYNNQILNEIIDWESVNKRLDELRIYSKNWLLSALLDK